MTTPKSIIEFNKNFKRIEVSSHFFNIDYHLVYETLLWKVCRVEHCRGKEKRVLEK
jgi:hypothetical protein